MKKYQCFLSKNFQFLEVKFSIYLNRRVFVMLINTIPELCRLISSGIPDHSLLSWKIETRDLNRSYDNGSLIIMIDLTLREYRARFLSSEESLTLINSAISNLEQGLQSQADIDNIYSEWCYLVYRGYSNVWSEYDFYFTE